MRLLSTVSGLAVTLFVCGCVSPGPQGFVDTESLPKDFVGRHHQVYAKGSKLVIEVLQVPGFNVAQVHAFALDGALYLEPFHISSGGSGTSRFEIDAANYKLPRDWPGHVYWVVESYGYPFCTPGFWSKSKQSPWVRKRVEVAIK